MGDIHHYTFGYSKDYAAARARMIARAAVAAVPHVLPYLSPEARKAAAAPYDIPSINAAYHDAVTQALTDYFEGANVTGPRNEFKQAMVEAFGAAFDLGWQDGGQEPPPDKDALDWLNGRVEQEMGFIEQVFVQAKELRKDPQADTFTWTTARADGFTASVAAAYNAALLLAKGNQMLTWHLGATETHCKDCARLDGQSHRASYYIAHDFIPGKPGAAMECGGFKCDCSITDKAGNTVTLGEE